jgi:hypothetical protein
MNPVRMFAEYPPKPEQNRRMDSLRECARMLAIQIQHSTPAGPNRTLALRRVDDALTLAEKAITQDEADSRGQSWTVYVDLDDRGSYLIENKELFREEPGGSYTLLTRLAAPE